MWTDTVYKNTLVNRAIEGTDIAGAIADSPGGTQRLWLSATEDATAPARVLNGAIKEYKKMEFKGRRRGGRLTTTKTAFRSWLADIPSRDALIARFMGSIQSPVSKAVRTFARRLRTQIAEQKEA